MTSPSHSRIHFRRRRRRRGTIQRARPSAAGNGRRRSVLVVRGPHSAGVDLDTDLRNGPVAAAVRRRRRCRRGDAELGEPPQQR